MPGTTSNGMPASSRAWASSPPRPNTNGSPPLRRTTRRPARASSTSSVEISSCGTGRPGRLPTSISSAVGGTSAEHAVADERVVHDDVGGGQQARRLDRQQVRVAGPGPDQRDRAIMPRRRRRLGGAGAQRRRTTGSGSHVAMVSAPTPCDQAPNDSSEPA